MCSHVLTEKLRSGEVMKSCCGPKETPTISHYRPSTKGSNFVMSYHVADAVQKGFWKACLGQEGLVRRVPAGTHSPPEGAVCIFLHCSRQSIYTNQPPFVGASHDVYLIVFGTVVGLKMPGPQAAGG